MQYTTNQRFACQEAKISIVGKFNLAVNKSKFALKMNIPVSTLYYWSKKYRETGSIENKSRKPKTSPRKIKNRKVIKRIKELHKEGRGKYYIKAQLNLENIKIGTSAIVGVLKRLRLWKYKKKKTKKRYNGKYGRLPAKRDNIKEIGKIIQIDTKYVKIFDEKYNKFRTVYQYTAIDLASRYAWRAIYGEKTPENATKFLYSILENIPFKIQSIQSDNGTEFTYRFLQTKKLSQFDLACKRLKIERRFIPVATPRFNGVVERVHGTDEREFYQKLSAKTTLDELKIQLQQYSYFYNTQRCDQREYL